MAAEGEKRMITLKSSDGEEFEVEEKVAMESQTIRHMIEDECADNGIPLPNVNSKILSKVIEYCNKHVHAAAAASKAANPADADANSAAANNSTTTAASGEDLKNWDADFVKVDQAAAREREAKAARGGGGRGKFACVGAHTAACASGLRPPSRSGVPGGLPSTSVPMPLGTSTTTTTSAN